MRWGGRIRSRVCCATTAVGALVAALAAASCSDSPTSVVTDDPRTPACIRGDLSDGAEKRSSLGPGDCRSESEGVLAEVWRLTVPAGMQATVTLRPTFDGVLVFFDANGVEVDFIDDEWEGGEEVGVLPAPGLHYVVVAGYEETHRGPYTIQATVGPVQANVSGFYLGTATTTVDSETLSWALRLWLTQGGNSVSGQWELGTDFSGNVSGTVSGETVNFGLTQSAPCPGTFQGAADLVGGDRRLQGSFTGTNCFGTWAFTFLADRQ